MERPRNKELRMYRVELDKVTGIMVGQTEHGAYKSKSTFPSYKEAAKHADKVQDRLNHAHNSGASYYPYWEQRIVLVAA